MRSCMEGLLERGLYGHYRETVVVPSEPEAVSEGEALFTAVRSDRPGVAGGRSGESPPVACEYADSRKNPRPEPIEEFCPAARPGYPAPPDPAPSVGRPSAHTQARYGRWRFGRMVHWLLENRRSTG